MRPAILVLAWAAVAHAIPGMDSLFRQTSVFVPGQDVIRVRPSTSDGTSDFVLRSSNAPGIAGDAVVTDLDANWQYPPPLFFIDPANSKLMLFVNSTTMLHVNVLNTTKPEQFQNFDKGGEPVPLTSAQIPLKVAFSKKSEGIKGGVWSYIGTLLTYDLPAHLTKGNGRQTNQGIFFQCSSGKAYKPGLFTSLDPSVIPNTCNVVTLHSMNAPSAVHQQRQEL
ncbi:hypothetical protein BKA62DRAFT_697980 [Auriculariales sp. MPI-PUGE-AT-0066]|nr:hypothetical protein BKA62DRAFT_697980 [Auriculariales sp. MPI-PUGE-AT-0066]